jgi:hypothetical protein
LGINDTGEIPGFYSDAAGDTHGFIYAGGAFNTVDVAGVRGTQLTRIKNGGPITGLVSWPPSPATEPANACTSPKHRFSTGRVAPHAAW